MRALRIAAWTAIAAVLTATLLLFLYNKRSESELQSRVYIPTAARITPELQFLQQYIRIDTTNPPGNESAGARFLAALLAKGGVRSEIIEPAPGRGSIYARIKGKKPGGGLLLLHHIDVMPATPRGWTRPPFAATLLLDQLYGRGALDMKSIGICELTAFLDVARSGRVPEHDLVFLGVADEESGGSLGMAWLLAHRPDVFEGVAYAINEGGITETTGERLTYYGIELGSKMAVDVRLRSDSRADLQRARIALEPFIAPPDPDRISPEVRAYFRDIAAQRVTQKRFLEDIDKTVADGRFWLLPRGYKELTQNVLWPEGVVKDGAGWHLDVHLFNLPDEQPPARIEWLRGVVAPYGVTVGEVLRTMGPAPVSSRETPLYALIVREAKATYGNVPVGSELLAASFNDSRFLRAHGIDCYGIWPFQVDFFQTQTIHGVDERVRADWFDRGVRMMRNLVSAYAFE